jgi:hypothetical protein
MKTNSCPNDLRPACIVSLVSFGLSRQCQKISALLVILSVAVASTPETLFATETNGIFESVFFKARELPPPYKVPSNLAQYDKLFRLGLETLPEGLLVWGALILGSQDMGLSESQGTNLTALLSETYAAISADPVFDGVTSALPFCLSTQKQSEGHYFVYRPKELPKDPTIIVFLHGFGGNFQFYTWALKEAFPDAVILAPSWNASWHAGPASYVNDMITDAQKRFSIQITKPWLFAISAGGRAGFRIYNEQPSSFQGYVCIASAPEDKLIPTLRRNLNVLMINGKQDRMFPIDGVRQRATAANRRIPGLQYKELDGNHFFVLGNREKTFETIKQYMNSVK